MEKQTAAPILGRRVSDSGSWHEAGIFLQGVLQEEYGDGVDDGVVLQVDVKGGGERSQDHEALKDHITMK